MIDTAKSPIQIILYEGEGSATLDGGHRFSLVTECLERGYRFTAVTREGSATAFPHLAERVLVLGDFEEDVPVLEAVEGVADLQIRNIGGMRADDILQVIESFRDNKPMNQPPSAASANGGKSWKPWFPVIDYDRCTNCMQCLSFCLFDVYSVDLEQRIQVLNQDNCKTNCPACSRVCPEVAIMFPKYNAGPINGEPVSDSDVKREKMKVDISSLLGGDIYARLRDRSVSAKSRFSKERSSDKALKERVKCLKKLKTDGMIPQEVLDELDLSLLPSAEEIQQKAKLAAAKAQAALDSRK